ncbi:MAG: hypothetical protein WCC22_12570 [Terriglobales bacterium]
MACALTESDAKNPETCVREEPGYISDEKTPARISAGFCQLLISTARLVMKDPNIDRAWLLDVKNLRGLYPTQLSDHGLGSDLRRLRL